MMRYRLPRGAEIGGDQRRRVRDLRGADQRGKKCHPPHHPKPITAIRPTGTPPNPDAVTTRTNGPNGGTSEVSRRDSRPITAKPRADNPNRLITMIRLIGAPEPRSR